MLNNKKGLSGGLIAMIATLLAFAIVTLVVNLVWGEFNNGIQGMSEDIVSNTTKEAVDNLGVYVGWGDRLFMWLFIALLIGYLISAATLPPDQPALFLVFMAFLAAITLVAMILSNAWVVISNQSAFITHLGELPMTDYILTHFPVITFFVGIIGAVIFFTRKNEGGSVGGVGFE